MKTIYLDHNSTTPLRPAVLEAMLPYLNEAYGNASSPHQMGQRARKAIENARAQLARLIGAADPEEIIFTSGGTESNNTSLRGLLTLRPSKKPRLVSTAIEHASVRSLLKDMGESGEIENAVVPVQPNGIVAPPDIEDALSSTTLLVSVMAANNETGTRQPVSEISRLCGKKDIPLHSDAIQLAGKYPLDVNALGVDLLSLSAHKFGGPKGVGALYIRKGIPLKRLLSGGRQENNRRGGTENVAGIVGMGQAAEEAQKSLGDDMRKLQRLRNRLETGLTQKLSHCHINGDPSLRLGNTSNICFEYTDSSELVMALDLKGISCSNGSACASGSPDPSHVLLAMGLPQEKAHASIRFSLGWSTTEEEIQTAIPLIVETVNALRPAHPLWKEAVHH